MTPSHHDDRCERLNSALVRAVPDLSRRALNEWEHAPDNVTISFVPLNQSDGYLRLEAGVSLPDEVTVWNCFERALSLPPGIKLVRDDDGGWIVRAESFVNEDELDLDARVLCMWARFESVRQLPMDPVLTEETGAASPTPDLARLCAEANWPFTPRAEGRVAVPLESGTVPVTAIVAFDGLRTVRVAVEVLESESLSEISRQANGEFLARLCNLVRLVRAGVLATENLITVRLEVALDAGASAAELGHALSVLSVACRWSVAELEALQDEAVAREVTNYTPDKQTAVTAVTAGMEEP